MKTLYVDTVDIDEILDELTDATSCVVYNIYEDVVCLKEEVRQLKEKINESDQ